MPASKWSFATVLIEILAVLMIIIMVIMIIAAISLHGTFGGGIMWMGATLALVWNIIGGALMYEKREHVRQLVQRHFSRPRLTFVVFATLLALLEEAITTSLTNLAPLFGSPGAFITSSGNYLEVVLFHSVVVFIPMFIVWAWLLGKYRFSPASVFLLFGINGIMAEAMMSAGTNAFIAAPFWVFVYGLMVFLPAYTFNFEKFPGTTAPRWYHYPFAVIACLAASAVAAAIVVLLSPHLPHFGSELLPPQ